MSHFLYSFATAMNKKLLTLFKRMLCAAFITGAVLSCENEKPRFDLPEHNPGGSGYLYIESLTPDTFKFRMRDSVVFSIRTVPYDLLQLDSIGIQVCDTAGAPYNLITVGTPRLRSDGVWNITGYLSKGIQAGDIVSLMITYRDTVLRSDPAVLSPILVQLKPFTTLTPDTLTFNEGDTALFRIRTSPVDLLSISHMSVELADTAGNRYEYADICSTTLTDSIWNIKTLLRYGMNTGDIVVVKVSDTLDNVSVLGRPIVLNMIPKPVPVYYALDLAEDSISAFTTENSLATIRFRTSPWDILLNDTTYHLTLTDTLGASISSLRLNLLEFQPQDSCWKMEVKITDIRKSDFLVQGKLYNTDTAYYSKRIDLKKVSFGLQTVKGQGFSASVDSKTASCSVCIPTLSDFSKVQLTVSSFSGDKVMYDNTEITKNKAYTVDGSKPIILSVWKYDIHKDYTISFRNTGLPIVKITTSRPVTRRDTWVEGNTMRIEMPDGTVDYEGTLSLKGHGNQTWSDFDKKPYGLKLDEKAKILGMHKQKRWILLANYKDRTLMRNDICFWISRQTDMPYTVNGQFVELVWNGEHRGNYYLCEQIRIDNHRIDIVKPKLDDPENGGIFMKIDAFYDYSNNQLRDSKWDDKRNPKPVVFRSSTYSLPYVFKDPDEDEEGNQITSSSKVYKYMQGYVDKMETAISKAATSNEWMQYLDMDRAIDYALIQEITMNHDAYNTWPENGPKSHNLYKDSCGKVCFGPMWDYDYHTFTLYGDFEYGSTTWNSTENPRIKQWEVLSMSNNNKNGKFYYSDLKKNKVFKDSLVAKWDRYKVKWEEGFEKYVDQTADKIRLSEEFNDRKWDYTSRQNGDWQLTFDQAVDAIKKAFRKRLAWIDANIGNL